MKVPAYIVWVLVQFLLTYIASNLKEWHHHLFQIIKHGTGDEIAAMPMLLTTNKAIYQIDNNKAQQNGQGSDREKDSAVRCYRFRGTWLRVVYVSKNQIQYAAILVTFKISSSTSTLTNLKTANATTDLDVEVFFSNGGTGYNGKKFNCPKPDPCHGEAEKRGRVYLAVYATCTFVLIGDFFLILVVAYLRFRSR